MTESRDSILDTWGERTPFQGEAQWPARLDQRMVDAPDRWVQSACVLCSNACALDVGVKDGRIVGVRGRPQDRSNRGRLGPKGLHGWVANNSPDRLLRPLIRSGGTLREASWDEAMELIVRQTRTICDRFTSSAIGFYSSGQLMLEEYYTLALIGRAGLGTPHLDGNIRLCTATASASLKETFGMDGQPGTVEDIDCTDCILHVGHNVAFTDTVMWMRVLDRRRGPNPPKLVVVDPRRTSTADEADVWLAPRPGTNLALLNGLLYLLIRHGHVDPDFIAQHTLGYDALARIVEEYPPDRVETITGVPADLLVEAAHLIGDAPTLVSTCLQGVYQSNQATASACQVNNIHLVRGLIGRPGCGILQMNGQPSAQNTRECGVYEDLSGFRNWENPTQVADLARIWNVRPQNIPHWQPGTHALEMFHYAETGTLRMLWIQGTNPAVSLPDLGRVRAILQKPDLFVVVQDAFMTETARLADVVLPAALWAEKTGTFTNFDRTVHLSEQAVEPPGEARSDLDVLLDYAHRMGFHDKDGAPLIKWATPEGAFEAWKECSRGRPCDYTGLSYAKLRGASGIPWPCNQAYPDGKARLYADHVFPTSPDRCATFGHDLLTGGRITPADYHAMEPAGRAFLKSSHYHPAPEQPDEAYPVALTTGRVLHQFHTRTKTARSPELNRADPAIYIEVSLFAALRLWVVDGDLVRVTSRRGAVEVPVRIGAIEDGHAFMPFHYGYWDKPEHAQAANELTLFVWDPVSKQPMLKYAAVKLERASTPVAAPKAMGKDSAHQSVLALARMGVATAARKAAMSVKPPRQHIADHIGLLRDSVTRLAAAFEQTVSNHPDLADVSRQCSLFAGWSHAVVEKVDEVALRYGMQNGKVFGRSTAVARHATPGEINLLFNLQGLLALVSSCQSSLTILHQAASAVHDEVFLGKVNEMTSINERMQQWLQTYLLQSASQAVVVPN